MKTNGLALQRYEKYYSAQNIWRQKRYSAQNVLGQKRYSAQNVLGRKRYSAQNVEVENRPQNVRILEWWGRVEAPRSLSLSEFRPAVGCGGFRYVGENS
jgi:hypothetical protein